MSYFGTPQTPLAGRADLFQANPDFQSLLDASLFDLGTASNSDLTQTTAAPATGPSGAVGASSLQPAPTINGVTFGQGYDLSDKDRLNIDLVRALQPDDSKYDEKLEKLRSAMREDAERANKMGRKNMLLGSLLKDIPKAVTNMAMAGTVYNAQNAVGPYNAAQYGRKYFT
ncbi:MAG: hypothetical protein WBH26_07330 [Pontimonas sp.]